MTETTAVTPATTLALAVTDLELAYKVRGIDRPVLRGVSFDIEPGRSYGLVGESGCGKSTAALGIVRYLPRNGRITGGSITVAGRDVLALSRAGLRDYHARTVSMVYQNPGSALNPTIRVGEQVAEVFRHHRALAHRAASEASIWKCCAKSGISRTQLASRPSTPTSYPAACSNAS